jgi:hypothetical protein
MTQMSNAVFYNDPMLSKGFVVSSIFLGTQLGHVTQRGQGGIPGNRA